MNCTKILEMAYEEDLNIVDSAQIWLHTFFCQDCAQKIQLYKSARTIMRMDFFTSNTAGTAAGTNIEDSVMAKINMEQQEETITPVILSTKGWVIAGLLIIVSFVTAFLGLDFKNVANATGMSFMLPIGIIFGIVLTSYCALFIGSHLKEFTERFL
ncbi:MAG: peptidoglycan-binding protein [Treponema sp.]|jgi:hypothetical protein|nr:peptidoglycan-binding protein [Treponema sp.]